MNAKLTILFICLAFLPKASSSQQYIGNVGYHSQPALDISTYLDLAYQTNLIAKQPPSNPSSGQSINYEDIYSINHITVWPHNYTFFGWKEEQIKMVNGVKSEEYESPYVEIVCFDPTTFKGAVRISLPKSVDEDLRRVRFRNDAYSGVYLRQITGLSYSTYMVFNKNHTAPVLVLQIDVDDDGTRDCNISFNPQIQHVYNSGEDCIMDFAEVSTYVEQSWKASAGWWNFEPTDGRLTPPAQITDHLFRIQDFISVYPNARTINTVMDAAAGGAIRFTVGGDDPDYTDFHGYILNFYIGTHPYAADFYSFRALCSISEPTLPISTYMR